MLRLGDKWVWDFWIADDGPDHHIFFLQAPRSLGDPELRHHNATIGHAVSTDLREWRVLPDALTPGPRGAWDDLATWTGSVVRRDGTWWCFYTGVSTVENGLVQRVGAALSDDLIHWRRHPKNPLIELDPSRYERLDLTSWHDQAWRDPWVMALNGHHEAFLTARLAGGPADGRGVVARATSADLVSWDVEDPLEIVPPHMYGHMEVPQVVALGDRWYLLFCTDATTHSAAWAGNGRRPPATGSFYAVGDAPGGPFHLVDADPLGPDDGSVCYSGRIVETSDGPMFLAWRMLDATGHFVGEIIDPIPVRAAADGRLVLES